MSLLPSLSPWLALPSPDSRCWSALELSPGSFPFRITLSLGILSSLGVKYHFCVSVSNADLSTGLLALGRYCHVLLGIVNLGLTLVFSLLDNDIIIPIVVQTPNLEIVLDSIFLVAFHFPSTSKSGFNINSGSSHCSPSHHCLSRPLSHVPHTTTGPPHAAPYLHSSPSPAFLPSYGQSTLLKMPVVGCLGGSVY